MIDHIIPQYFLTTYKNKNIINQYTNVGHNEEMISLYNYHEPNPMPKCVYEYIKPHFNFLDNLALAVNYFKPGQYLPLHSDLYEKYIKVYEVNPKNIVRVILMLEDSSPGQILQIMDKCISHWKSGDFFWWENKDLHAFYNFSLKDRYAIQVTGSVK